MHAHSQPGHWSFNFCSDSNYLQRLNRLTPFVFGSLSMPSDFGGLHLSLFITLEDDPRVVFGHSQVNVAHFQQLKGSNHSVSNSEAVQFVAFWVQNVLREMNENVSAVFEGIAPKEADIVLLLLNW